MGENSGDEPARGPHGTLIAPQPGVPLAAPDAMTLVRPAASQDSRPDLAPPPQPTPTPAERAAPRHQLIKLLGKGGMGEVFIALDPELHRRVAFKRLLPELVGNRGVSARFLTEVQVTAQLDHPNIVPVNGFEVAEDGTLGYSMKLIKGRDLSKLIEKWRTEAATATRAEATRRLASRLDIFLRVCEAMTYAHGKGVLHRDLKPENVMVGAYNDVYVMDWGIFRVIGSPASEEEGVTMTAGAAEAAGHGNTLDGMVIGTPAYMSPEQACGQIKILDQRSDVFTLGVILAELLTLQPPRPEATLEQTLVLAQLGQLAPLAPANPRHRIPAELKAIVARATRVAPAERYQTARELADDVRRYLRGESVRARPDNPVQALARALARHRMVALAVILGLIALGGATVAWQIRARSQAEEANLRRHARHQVLAAAAARQAHALDTDFARWQVAAALLVGRASQAVANPDPDDPQPPLFYAADFDEGRGPADLKPSRRYRTAISIASPVVKLAPDVQVTGDLERSIGYMVDLRRSMQNALLVTAPTATMQLDDDAARDLLLGDGLPALRAFVTLASGVHVSYPGYGGYEPDYDGRLRKKYTSVQAAATGVRRVQWGELFADRHGLGLVLPIAGVLFDRGEQVAGVAGLELSVTWIAEHSLAIPGVSWAEEFDLLDTKGQVIIHLPAGGSPVYPDATAGEAGELHPIAFSILEARRAAAAEESGVLELPGGRVAAVYPLSTIDYTFVVIADARRVPTQ